MSDNLTERVYKVLREYGGTISVDDIITLLGWDISKGSKGRVKAALLNIKRKGVKIENKRGFGYKFISAPTDIVFSQRHGQKAPIGKPAAPKQDRAELIKPEPPVHLLDDKCYFLIKAHAGRTVTSAMVADFFNISDEGAVCMLNRVCKRYKDIKCSITAVSV